MSKRIAVLGLGSIGSRHVDNLLAMGHEVVAFDLLPKPDEKRVPVMTSVQDVLAWKPTHVVVCTPPRFHDRGMMVAEHAHAHCFVEKPIADHVSRAALMEFRRQGLTLAVGYQLRFQLDDVFAGNLHFECSQDMSQWPSRYEKDVLLEFSHEIDAAVYINGPVEKVTAKCEPSGWMLKLRHIEHVSTVWINPRSSVSVRGIEHDGSTVWEFCKEENDEAYKDEMATFLAVSDGAPWDSRLCSGAEAVHVLRIIEACRESTEQCRVVSL